MNMKDNKKGTDKILSAYWFAILFIVAGGVIYMTVLFYGGHYDIRSIEANILIDKIADCLSKGGMLEEDWKDINQENFLRRCNLNFNVEDTNGWKDDQYYIRVDFEEFQGSSGGDSIIVGNKNLQAFCDKGLTCAERNLYTLDNENKQYVIKIKSIVRKTEKNV